MELSGFGFADEAEAVAAFETVGGNLVLDDDGSMLVPQGAAGMLTEDHILLV